MKQTAVSWLIERIEDVDLTEEMFESIKQQAKEMEKQQIIDARLKPLLLFSELRIKHGYFGGYDNGQVIEREINQSEQYYNETFKSE